jgi:hypothetical protein
METLKLELRESDLISLGLASLISRIPMIAERGLPKKLILVFPQTTVIQKIKSDSKNLILLEYNIPCLIQDVIWLIRHGVDVSVEMK